jgi:hydroxymethylpyrimidine/phosphomethylpyrimidine kinase
MASRSEREQVLGNVTQAVAMLETCAEFSALMPEVRVNIVHALAGAKSGKDVAAVEGRITVVNGHPHASGLPKWGASDHMARLVIEVRKYNKEVNAGINFRCDELVIDVVKKYAGKKGLRFGWIDRTKEPKNASTVDGASMPWKVKWMARKFGKVPQVFYEGDGWGKEPLFMLVGENAVSVTEIAMEIARQHHKARIKQQG